jgi:propanol-preferring alcohol dehydrogenase
VAINAIHLDRVPELPYEELWLERTITSVANFTRQDAREFLELAARIPVRTAFDTFQLADANVALDRLEKGQVRGAAVLVT